MGQNEKLAGTLQAEQERIEALREEVEKLSQPPASFGVYLGTNEDGSVDVFTAGRKMRVNVSPDSTPTCLRKGAEVILNEALNVVEVLDARPGGRGRQGQGPARATTAWSWSDAATRSSWPRSAPRCSTCRSAPAIRC